jgi:hypothetical protein
MARENRWPCTLWHSQVLSQWFGSSADFADDMSRTSARAVLRSVEVRRRDSNSGNVWDNVADHCCTLVALTRDAQGQGMPRTAQRAMLLRIGGRESSAEVFRERDRVLDEAMAAWGTRSDQLGVVDGHLEVDYGLRCWRCRVERSD